MMNIAKGVFWLLWALFALFILWVLSDVNPREKPEIVISWLMVTGNIAIGIAMSFGKFRKWLFIKK